MASQTSPHVLVIDDDPSIRDMVSEYLVDNGMRVSVGASGQDMFAVIASCNLGFADIGQMTRL